MKKAPITAIFSSISLAGLVLAATFTMTIQAFAATAPTLTITNNGNASVQLTVSGDAYSQVQLFYSSNVNGTAGGSVATAGIIGNTAANGYLSTTISGYQNNTSGYTGTYSAYFNSIPYGAAVYVIVDGLQSNVVSWPYYGNGNIGPINGQNGATGSLTFNQTNFNLTTGQSVTDMAYNAYNSTNFAYQTYSLFVSGNTNPSVANVSVSGSQVSILAQNPGSTVLTICTNGSNVNNGSAYGYNNSVGQLCGTIYVTVNYNGNYSGGYSGGYNGYQNYPSTSYINPIVPVQTIQVPTYIPATVYSAPAPVYSYPTYSYPSYPYSTSYATPTYYSTPSYYQTY